MREMSLIHRSLGIYGVSFLLCITFFLIERKRSKKLKLKEEEPITILVPCYNDGDSIGQTIKSAYSARNNDLLQMIVINDCSTDNSLEKLKKLQAEYGFMLIDNPVNKGKATSLNDAVQFAIHENLLILDADNIIEKRHLVDMLARMQRNPRVAATSCPYRSKNKGFLPAMTDIEYCMLDIIQGSYNLFGAISLWGGCLMVKKSAFLEVQKFSPRVLTEDMDLAFKLNKAGYKVEQSLIFIKSIVPDNFKWRWKQKLRRNGGGAHCFIKYASVWIKNPLHVILVFSFCFLVFSLVIQTILSRDLFQRILSQPNVRESFWSIVDLKYRVEFFLTKTSYTLLSLPYVLPLINSRKTLWRVLRVFPYSLVYLPLFSVAGAVGIFRGICNYAKLEKIGKKG